MKHQRQATPSPTIDSQEVGVSPKRGRGRGRGRGKARGGARAGTRQSSRLTAVSSAGDLQDASPQVACQQGSVFTSKFLNFSTNQYQFITSFITLKLI